MMHPVFAMMTLAVVVFVTWAIVRSASTIGAPRVRIRYPWCWPEAEFGITGIFVFAWVVTGLANNPAVTIWVGWTTTIAIMVWFTPMILAFRSNPAAAASETPLQGWVVSCGNVVWVDQWKRHGPAYFGWWIKALGFEHFVDGLEVLNFNAPCDNGGKVHVKAVVVPRGDWVSPHQFWSGVSSTKTMLAESIQEQAHKATSSHDINLNRCSNAWVTHVHLDTDNGYTGPEEHWRPYAPAA
ncbi:MAG: hypothetical protein NT039_01745 [Candidatus Berkelbacteria bacterium]|nr:hypothetical protein [Candidatus Berkelbacteria bacterium]